MLVVERLGAAAERGVSARPVVALDFAKRLEWRLCSSNGKLFSKGAKCNGFHHLHVPASCEGGASNCSWGTIKAELPVVPAISRGLVEFQ